MKLHKIFKYIALVIGVLGLILWARVLIAGDEAITSSADIQASVVSPFLYVGYLIFILILLLVLVFVVKGLFTGDVKKTLMSSGAVLLVVVIAYLVSGGSEMTMSDGEVIPESTVHWVSAGLITFYILAVVAVLLMVVSGVKKLIKK